MVGTCRGATLSCRVPPGSDTATLTGWLLRLSSLAAVLPSSPWFSVVCAYNTLESDGSTLHVSGEGIVLGLHYTTEIDWNTREEELSTYILGVRKVPLGVLCGNVA